jgi:hypothetical protein
MLGACDCLETSPKLTNPRHDCVTSSNSSKTDRNLTWGCFNGDQDWKQTYTLSGITLPAKTRVGPECDASKSIEEDKMSIKRIFAIAVVMAALGTATLFIAQAAAPHAPQPVATRPALNPALFGDPYVPGPCERQLGVNYVDGRLQGTPSPGHLGMNYLDGKLHIRDIPLFTRDGETLCLR